MLIITNNGDVSVNRTQKQEAIVAYEQTMEDSRTMVLVQNEGLTVAQMSDFRTKLREQGGSAKVVKNRLAQRAIEGTQFEGLKGLFKGPVIMVSSPDAIAAAKISYEYSKENKKLVLLGGSLGDKALDINGIEALAKLPSLDELRAKMIGMISTPATRMAILTQAPAKQLACVTKAYAEKG